MSREGGKSGVIPRKNMPQPPTEFIVEPPLLPYVALEPGKNSVTPELFDALKADPANGVGNMPALVNTQVALGKTEDGVQLSYSPAGAYKLLRDSMVDDSLSPEEAEARLAQNTAILSSTMKSALEQLQEGLKSDQPNAYKEQFAALQQHGLLSKDFDIAGMSKEELAAFSKKASAFAEAAAMTEAKQFKMQQAQYAQLLAQQSKDGKGAPGIQGGEVVGGVMVPFSGLPPKVPGGRDAGYASKA